MAIFNSYVSLPEGKSHGNVENHMGMINHPFTSHGYPGTISLTKQGVAARR